MSIQRASSSGCRNCDCHWPCVGAGLPGGSIDLMPIVETALGVESARDIAAAGPRVRRLAFGGGDYTTDLDIVWTAEEHELAALHALCDRASRVFTRR